MIPASALSGRVGDRTVPACPGCGSATVRVASPLMFSVERRCPSCGHISRVTWAGATWAVQ